MVIFETTSNNILAKAIWNRSAREMLWTYQVLVGWLHEKEIFPEIYVLDNQCSAELKVAIKHNKITFQRVPPHNHRRNVSEKTRTILCQRYAARTIVFFEIVVPNTSPHQALAKPATEVQSKVETVSFCAHVRRAQLQCSPFGNPWAASGAPCRDKATVNLSVAHQNSSI